MLERTIFASKDWSIGLKIGKKLEDYVRTRAK